MKWIGVTQRVETLKQRGERRDALDQAWMPLAVSCGFLPIVLPNHIETVQQYRAWNQIQGFLLTGGNDLTEYGGDAWERDQVERYLVEWAMEEELPFLGVCRGMQLLLCYFGTPLQRVFGHAGTEHRLDNGRCVNSFHDWGAICCYPPLVAEAYGEDGVVEAVRHERYSNLHGIMWHPERNQPFLQEDMMYIREVLRL